VLRGDRECLEGSRVLRRDRECLEGSRVLRDREFRGGTECVLRRDREGVEEG
jgi:hypothetical protein